VKHTWNLVENSLGEALTTVAGVESKYITWEKDLKQKKDKIFYLNNLIFMIRDYKTKREKSFAILFESKAIIPETYRYAYRIINQYNIFSLMILNY